MAELPAQKNTDLLPRVRSAKADRAALSSLVRGYAPLIHAELSTLLFLSQDREDLLAEAHGELEPRGERLPASDRG